jgi:hypothetical protein
LMPQRRTKYKIMHSATSLGKISKNTSNQV